MPKYNIDFGDNPSFNTVLGLSNTTFNPNNIVSGRMVTEQQLQDTWQRIYDDEQLIDRCCRDIILWEAHVQVVRLNTNSLSSNYNYYNSGGVVVSDFDENVTVGIMRRGMKYTVAFPLKWDNNLYVPHTAEAYVYLVPISYSNTSHQYSKVVQYRYIQGNDKIVVATGTSQTNNRANFLVGESSVSTRAGEQRGMTGGGILINGDIQEDFSQNWGSFTLDIKDDGTVNLTDNRRNTNFDIIKFYTQWTLRRCSDGSMLSDPS